MKPVKTIRECRIIKNGVIVFEGSDEKCLTFLLQLKNSALFCAGFKNSQRLIPEYKNYERMLMQ
jgi:hypothetical protein